MPNSKSPKGIGQLPVPGDWQQLQEGVRSDNHRKRKEPPSLCKTLRWQEATTKVKARKGVFWIKLYIEQGKEFTHSPIPHRKWDTRASSTNGGHWDPDPCAITSSVHALLSPVCCTNSPQLGEILYTTSRASRTEADSCTQKKLFLHFSMLGPCPLGPWK